MTHLDRVLTGLPVGALLLGAAAANETVQIDEWEVPYHMNQKGAVHDSPPVEKQQETRPRDASVDSRGRVWFAGQIGNYLAVLDPLSGAFRRYELSAGAHPHSLVIDAQDNVWYSGNLDSHIGKLDPTTGQVWKFPTEDLGVGDPHTMAWDEQGDLWFTAQHSGCIGRLSVATGEIEIIKIREPGARVYGIKLDSDHAPWVTLFGTNKILRVDPRTMQVTEFELPWGARPRRIALTSDDIVWYTDYAQGQLGRLDPATGDVRVWESPGGSTAIPYGIEVDDQDRVWYVESPLGRSRLVGFDTDSETFFSVTPFPSGGRAVRHMYFHQPTRSIWMGTDANTIARAHLP